MKKINFITLLLTVLIVSGLFSSCSNDDNDGNNTGNVPPELLRTWYLSENTSITFNANGTGSYTGDEEDLSVTRMTTTQSQTYSFTYMYDVPTKRITMEMGGEKMIWTIVVLTDETLKVKDEDEVFIYFTTEPISTPDNKVPDLQLLYGTWGYADYKVLDFAEDGTLITYSEGVKAGEGEYKTRTDEENKCIIISVKDGNWYDAYKINYISEDIITLTSVETSDTNTLNLFRYKDEDKTIGATSNLYNTWTDCMSGWKIVLDKDGKGSFTMEGIKFSITYTYNENNHKLTMTMKMNGETDEMEFEVVKLTAKILFLKGIDEDDGSEYTMEFRVL